MSTGGASRSGSRRLLGHLLALSRAPHSFLDVATPAAAALLWARAFPSLKTILVGLPTALVGYLAVYAVNDLVDIRADRRKIEAGVRDTEGYLDAVLVRHPVAAGLLGARAGFAWAAALAALAAAGSALLNPACLVVLAVAVVLETVYCRLASVTCLRCLVSGLVKTLGPVAAVLAVDATPSALPLALLVAWLFLFEIGGQNIPADWTDLEEDRRLGAHTVPLALGERAAGRLALGALSASVAAGLVTVGVLFRSGFPRPAGLALALLSLAAGLALLVHPAARLVGGADRPRLFALFNRASLYPAALLGVTGAVLVAVRLAG